MTVELTVSSPAFVNGGAIPRRYGCCGGGAQPPLRVTGLPEGTRALAVTMEDPDAPLMTFTHWVLFNVPAAPPEAEVPENAGNMDGAAVLGRNSAWLRRWMPPCPPFGEHRYIFTVYALDGPLGLRRGASARALRRAIAGRALGEGTLAGRFSRRQPAD